MDDCYMQGKIYGATASEWEFAIQPMMAAGGAGWRQFLPAKGINTSITMSYTRSKQPMVVSSCRFVITIRRTKVRRCNVNRMTVDAPGRRRDPLESGGFPRTYCV